MKIINRDLFPSTRQLVKGKRTAVLFRPIIGSVEQLVIGAVAFNSAGAFLGRANRLDRLQCFYGEQAAGAILAVELALDELEIDLANNPALLSDTEYAPLMSGVVLGTTTDAEGSSLSTIACSWLEGMSSLYASPHNSTLTTLEGMDLDETVRGERATDRLGELLLHYVEDRQPALISAFSSDIRTQVRRRRGNAHGVFIDFSGTRIVANFGMLVPSSYAGSIDRIKRRMWDLKISRDNEKSGFLARPHEMLVQHPPENDPQLTQKQVDKIMESVQDLMKQADQEEIRFRPMTSVEDIGNHLMAREAA